LLNAAISVPLTWIFAIAFAVYNVASPPCITLIQTSLPSFKQNLSFVHPTLARPLPFGTVTGQMLMRLAVEARPNPIIIVINRSNCLEHSSETE
jgi:hypothetical protein